MLGLTLIVFAGTLWVTGRCSKVQRQHTVSYSFRAAGVALSTEETRGSVSLAGGSDDPLLPCQRQEESILWPCCDALRLFLNNGSPT
jgi:hypothetical protein